MFSKQRVDKLWYLHSYNRTLNNKLQATTRINLKNTMSSKEAKCKGILRKIPFM